MKCLLIILIVFVNVVNSDTTKRLLLPQLPIGEYRLKPLAILRCELSQVNNLIKINYYLSKTSTNTTEIKGNFTNLVPLDDSFNVEINMAVKDSVGGWKDNAHIFKSPKACSSLKNVLGNIYNRVLDNLGMHNIRGCPIPVGCYVSSGMKNNDELYSNLPKQFFYGTYKLRFQFTKNKIVHGCVTYILEVKRPWETD
ncbi:uncharacterized protein LOC111036583 [Myzus persicae]|uniref:uncharacterized protein LOC111036583 n=1 Tax=Myzus persicae TaxID=13164 RepID=UPI000B9328BD|nr:uncharacterized protein LOC111036583 [Myzus persicae]